MRFVPLMSGTVDLLTQYTEERRLESSDRALERLFVNRKGLPLSRSGIRYILQKYVRQAQTIDRNLDDRITPHSLRHSKAMHLLQSGNPSIVIRDILGHTDIRTTDIYARSDLSMKEEALKKAVPLSAVPLATHDWRKDENLLEWLESL